MGYYLRAFTAGDARTPLREILHWARANGAELVPEPGGSLDVDESNWRQAVLLHPPTRRSFVAEAMRHGDEGRLLGEEVEEFVAELAGLSDSAERRRVLDALRAARAVIAAQLFRGREDEALEAAVTFLQFFVQVDGGLIQADEVGFFEGDELIVELC